MEKTFNKLKDDKLENFKRILEKHSQELEENFLFRDISKVWGYNYREDNTLKYFVKLSLADIKTIQNIHKDWHKYNANLVKDNKEIEFEETINGKTRIKLLNVFNKNLLNKQDKQILCYFYFLIVDYAFGYVHFSENDQSENSGHVKIERDYIEISVELVIKKLMNIFDALKDDDFNDKKMAGIFFALIVLCNEFNDNLNKKNISPITEYLEKKGDIFKVYGSRLCALRINYMKYIGVFPIIEDSNKNSNELVDRLSKECSLIFNEKDIIFFSSTSTKFFFDQDHAIKFIF
nr:2062_t:CDS:1 [Entrophospora candida]CAG8441732.1 6518_t:CDS:1 [Entrophospora candida]